MSQNHKNYLDLLNDPQKKAVVNTDGAYLILAGAGSGKTRVLTYRILHLLINKISLPHQILAVTFTNKAAFEMKNRVSKMINRPIHDLWLGTFHSISYRILKQYYKLIGLKSNFIILDTDDQIKIIKQICEREKLLSKEKPPKYFYNIIDNYKNNFITPENYQNLKIEPEVFKIYKIYEHELIRLNCVDFGNLLIHCIKIFKNNIEVLHKYQNQFQYILVDEFQDINHIQQLWLKYLYKKNKNICCVGDDDQSIYSWRGASIKNILNYKKNFSQSKIIKLEQNYRSTQNILDCASYLIANNKGRYGKKLWSKNGEGEKVAVKGFWETKEEAFYISDEIEKIHKNKVSYNEIAILLRVSAHSRSFEERFINIGLPYRIIGGLRFYERKEIKDAIAYLRLANNLNDDLAFERIINTPKRGIGQTTIKKIYSISRKYNLSMFEATKNYIDILNTKSKVEINNFVQNFIKWNHLKNKIKHEDLIQIILEDSKYLKFLEVEAKSLKHPENLSRVDNIKEFIESVKDFDNLEGFLEHVSLVMENIKDTTSDKVNIMTMHSSKGLEFDYVFLSGWEENVFPSMRSLEEFGKEGLEEERRLAYVAITRARKKILITYVNQNRYSYASHDFNTPSRFINELPKLNIDFNDNDIIENNDFLNDYRNISESIDEEIITPGRKRLLSKSNKDEIEWDINQDIYDNKKLTSGIRVFHQKFGYGTIINTDGNVAEVLFEKSSKRQIFIKYLKVSS